MIDIPPAAPTGGGRPVADAGSGKPGKRAVILIHGIGNQTPMETVRPFVEAVWTRAPRPEDSPKHLTWSQRDLKSDNLELWRITTNATAAGVRIDFFEFYWADLMEDTALADIVWWLKRLFWRRPARVPPSVFGTWIAGIVALLFFVAALGAYGWLALEILRAIPHSLPRAAGLLAGAAGITLVLWLLCRIVLIQFVGDAARYLTPSPRNIAAHAHSPRRAETAPGATL